jgi:hypothetical protein
MRLAQSGALTTCALVSLIIRRTDLTPAAQITIAQLFTERVEYCLTLIREATERPRSYRRRSAGDA